MEEAGGEGESGGVGRPMARPTPMRRVSFHTTWAKLELPGGRRSLGGCFMAEMGEAQTKKTWETQTGDLRRKPTGGRQRRRRQGRMKKSKKRER